MIETFELLPGVTLRCCQDRRFKQGRLSLQLVRPMCPEEAAKNALLPMVLLRGTEKYPNLWAITKHLDDLYGAAVGDLVRRIGDYQTTGFYCSFTEDRFALPGDRIFAPVVEFLGELLLHPLSSNGAFRREIVESEKKNLIADMNAERNDKAAYAGAKLLRTMCRGDSFGIPRLGEPEQAAAIDGEILYRHYRRILRESPVELFYVGSAEPEQAADVLRPLFSNVDRCYVNLQPQTPFQDAGGQHTSEEMDITQSRLCMGFVTPITNQSPAFAAMQVLNTLFGGGMTSKLFLNVREKMSLCYSIGSGYYGSKGIVTVSAGIDAGREQTVRQEVLNQLEACRNGDITDGELNAAREAVLSGLRGVPDSPGSIEGYYATAALSGLTLSLEEYQEAVENVTVDAVIAAAESLRLHSSFFLKGVGQ